MLPTDLLPNVAPNYEQIKVCFVLFRLWLTAPHAISQSADTDMVFVLGELFYSLHLSVIRL